MADVKNWLKFWSRYIRGKKVACSIDITASCNLKCPHCYWLMNKPTQELSDEEMTALLEKTYDDGIMWVILVGGEPLLRPEMVRVASDIFSWADVVSNGTIPLLDVPKRYFISLDGEEVRGKAYHKIWDNVADDERVIGTITLCTLNAHKIREIADQWAKSNISGITYNFYTPFSHNDPLWIPFEERRPFLDEITQAHEEYGWFVINPPQAQEHFLEKETLERAKNCGIAKYTICYDSMGNLKLPCVLGAGAMCNRCGCHTGIYMSNFKRPWGYRMAKRLHLNKPHSLKKK